MRDNQARIGPGLKAVFVLATKYSQYHMTCGREEEGADVHSRYMRMQKQSVADLKRTKVGKVR
jgi:hypothetical protein